LAGCHNIRRINAYHDGELAPTEARQVQQHLLQCPACRQELERLRALSHWLTAAPTPEVAPAAMDRLRHSVGPRRDRLVLRTAGVLTAVAAAVLIVCSALLWQARQAGPDVAGVPAEWETAAVMPEATAAAADTASGAAAANDEDEDVELAQSILGSLLPEGGSGHE